MKEDKLFYLLKYVIDNNASDLHLKTNHYPAIRIDGKISQLKEFIITKTDISQIFEVLLSEENLKKLIESGELDLAYNLDGISRFRVNIYKDINGYGLVFRVIPYKVMNFEEIGLPKSAQKLIDLPNGLILITGPTGAGKTTTLASFINYVNNTYKRHIVTLEDPIEYQFEDNLSIINQRQVGVDVASFYDGLLTVLRQDPDIIVVGEMRDPSTIQLTLNTAETGKLVLATLHTTSAVQTAERIVNVFPENQQKQVLLQLSMVLRGIISQTLVSKKNGGRVGAFEIMINTSAIRSLICDGKIHLIQSYLETGSEYGMQTLDMSLAQLVKKDVITLEEALLNAHNPNNIKKYLNINI